MGLCVSHELTEEEKQAKIRSMNMDRRLRQEARQENAKLKLLFLGAGESGKSTLFKQMRTIYGEAMTEEERKDWLEPIFINIIQSLHVLIGQTNDNYGGFGEDTKAAADAILKIDFGMPGLKLTAQEAKLVTTVVSEPNVATALQHRADFHLFDGAEYLYKHVDRLCGEGCVPTIHDILRTRVRTTGITSATYEIESCVFEMYDLGGQRSERKKWMGCFEDVTAVVFVAAASGFNQVLFEDQEMNRLIESLNIFEDITSSRWFKKTAFILFLNKDDVFREKIAQGASITSCFPEYKGENTYEDQMQYIKKQFRQRTDKQFAIHCTTATNQGNIETVFEEVKNIVIEQALANVEI